MKAILDRKVVFMGNGLNIGNVPGEAQDLAPMLAALLAKDPKNTGLRKLKTQIQDSIGRNQAKPKTGSGASQ